MPSLFNQIGGDALLYLVAIVFVIAVVISLFDMSRRRRRFIVEEPTTLSELSCPSCSLKEVRRYKEGDYVMKKTEEKCRSCDSIMTIVGIYAESKKSKR